MATVWSTRHALTTGITKNDDAEICERYAYMFGGCNYLSLAIGRDAWLTEEDAKKRAISMAKNKLATIAKQKAKLEKRIAYWSEELK